MTFGAFWRNECAPVLHAGFHPPLAEGFHRFIQARPVAEAIHKNIEEELKSGKADPYDTHPPLKERIAAVEALGVGETRSDEAPALSLLADVPALEKQLLQTIAGPEQAGKLNPIEWPNVCTQVYLPQWKKLVEVNVAALSNVQPESLPGMAANRKALKFVFVSGEQPAEANAEGLAGAVIGAALVLALTAKGGKIQAAPGENVSVVIGSLTLEPFGIMEALANGSTKADQWQQQIAQAGITGVNLSDTWAEIPVETETREVSMNDDSRFMPKES
jgi:heat shock protein HtpX